MSSENEENPAMENGSEDQQETAPSKSGKRGRRKGEIVRKKRKPENLNLYIYKVLKQVHPEIGLSKKSMNVMNSFLMDLFDKLANEAANAVKYAKRNTTDARAIQCAVRLVLPEN